MLPSKLAFVDIETTGMRASFDRIIEIGILRVEQNKITQTYQSLINPQAYLPREITRMTGITSEDLENAPTFRQIKDDILETLSGTVFVAHNVRFDYSFLKNEFRRLNHTFTKKHFCTVRLSRALFPEYKHHNLDSLIQRFGFSYEKRHRAFDDAKILFSFYEKILSDFPLEQIAKAINIGLKKPALPLKLKTDLASLPEHPGVYIFYGKKGTPLYIGKSINLHDRILSHFSSDIRSPLEMKISQQIESIEIIQTAGELGALILESQLIKKMLPLYNQKSRLKKELIAIIKETNKEGYDTVKIETIKDPNIEYQNTKQIIVSDLGFRDSNFNSILGLFRSRKQAKALLAETAGQYNLCEKLLGLEKTHGACFAHRLGKCQGACIGKEKPVFYNLKFTSAFSSTKIKSWPFPGTIIIEESDGFIKEYFLINKWCFLGSIKIDAEDNENNMPDQNPTFDLDIYKILKQYLSQPQNIKKIRPYPALLKK